MADGKRIESLIDEWARVPEGLLPEHSRLVRGAAMALTTTYLANPDITLEQLKPRFGALIEALDHQADLLWPMPPVQGEAPSDFSPRGDV